MAAVARMVWPHRSPMAAAGCSTEACLKLLVVVWWLCGSGVGVVKCLCGG